MCWKYNLSTHEYLVNTPRSISVVLDALMNSYFMFRSTAYKVKLKITTTFIKAENQYDKLIIFMHRKNDLPLVVTYTLSYSGFYHIIRQLVFKTLDSLVLCNLIWPLLLVVVPRFILIKIFIQVLRQNSCRTRFYCMFINFSKFTIVQ